MSKRFEEARIYIESKGGKMISQAFSYGKNWDNARFEWSCDKGHSNRSGFQLVKRENWCQECKFETARARASENVKNAEMRLVKYNGANKLTVECAKGHVSIMTSGHLVEGNRCSKCYKESLKLGKPRLTKEEVSQRLSVHGFEFMDQTFKTLRTEHTIKCVEGHITKRPLQHIIHGVVGCSECNNYFSSERKFRKLVEKELGVPFPKARPEWLVSPETGFRLELDCYNQELKLAFEYDGNFHFEVRNGLNNDLAKTKKNDQYKEEIARENGVTLVRVPYFMKNEEVLELIRTFK